jgi:hypothetical protein
VSKIKKNKKNVHVAMKNKVSEFDMPKRAPCHGRCNGTFKTPVPFLLTPQLGKRCEKKGQKS